MALRRSILASSALLGLYASYIYKTIPNIPIHTHNGNDMTGPTTQLINPLNYPSQTESYRADIPAPKDAASLDHLIKGFFNNPVFAPESLILRLLHIRFTKFLDGPVVWRVPDENLTVGTTILGMFQVVQRGPDFVDLAYGLAWFAGFHRLSIDRVGMRLECMFCSPSSGGMGWMMGFHRWYARTLFRFAVAAAVAGSEVKGLD